MRKAISMTMAGLLAAMCGFVGAAAISKQAM